MALGNTGGASGTWRKDDWMDLAEDKVPTVVVFVPLARIEPRAWDRNKTLAPTPGATANFAFISGPRQGEVLLGETVISKGIVDKINERPIGSVTAARVGKYTSFGSEKPCFNPASEDEVQAAQEALDAAAKAGYTFVDSDGDTVGDVCRLYQALLADADPNAVEAPF